LGGCCNNKRTTQKQEQERDEIHDDIKVNENINKTS
jgi:hypothetical protein